MLEIAAGHGSVEQNYKSGQGSQGTVMPEKKKKVLLNNSPHMLPTKQSNKGYPNDRAQW